MPVALSKRPLTEDTSPPFAASRKLGVVAMALVWQGLHQDPQCPSRVVLDTVAQRQVPIAVRVRHLNRLRAQWKLHRRKGRPGQTAWNRPVGAGAVVVQVAPPLSFVGLHLFARWLDQHDAFDPVVARLQQAIEASKHTPPDDDFARLPPRESPLLRRLQALFFAPLLGLETLTGFDTHEPPLQTLLGRGSHRSTRKQFLGQRERLHAAEPLMPTLLPATAGQMTSVDGHLIADWSRLPRHKGKSTMLGRLRAGSHAGIAHTEAGQALVVASYPPAVQVSQVIVDSCQKVALATGTALFVIDRAVHSVAMACAFSAQGLGVLCMLDDNEPQGRESFVAPEIGTLEDGTKVYSGEWKGPRPEDPRHFVLVAPAEGKLLVDWGTPTVQEPLETANWPRVYRDRNELQEHRFKRMLDHGALDTTSGRKRIVGPDRHQHRARATLHPLLAGAQKRVDKQAKAVQTQQDKVAASAATGHGKRLEQRQRAWVLVEKECQDAQDKHAKLREQAAALGSPRERADRDVRQQTIMPFRTLLLENALMSFMAALSGHLKLKVSLDGLLRILFERSGARMETASHLVYWVNTAGLSVPYRRLLTEVVAGLCAMDMRDQGKPIRVRLKDLPP